MTHSVQSRAARLGDDHVSEFRLEAETALAGDYWDHSDLVPGSTSVPAGQFRDFTDVP